MRFLMLNWRDPLNPRAGGAERVTQGYLNALAERGHSVTWFANQFPGAASNEMLGSIRLVRGGGVGSSVLEARNWLLEQPRFDLVVDQHHGIPWYAPWWCGTRCVAYVHEVLGPIWDAFYRAPWSDLGRLQERWTHWLYRDVPFWTACESTRDHLMRHGVEHVQLIRYGVHTKALAELEPKVPGVPVRLVAVSRLAPNKRVDHALSVVRLLLDRGVSVEMDIVGEGEVERELRQQAQHLGLGEQVRFCGFLKEEEKDRLLRQAHLLLHCSVREGWGLNVIEANAMGTPAVVYPVPGLIESTLDDETGLVASAETPEAMVDRIGELVADHDRYERLRRGAWERAKTMHWDRVLPAACDWLERCARGEPLETATVEADANGAGRG